MYSQIKTDSLENFFRLSPLQKAGLKKLGLKNLKDLLFYFPSRYQSSSEVYPISTLRKGDKAVVFGKIKNLETAKTFKSKIAMAKGIIEDTTGKIEVAWFHQPYIAKMLGVGALVKIEGIVGERKGKLYFSNPKTEKLDAMPETFGSSLFGDSDQSGLYPVYSETKGISSLWLFHSIQKLIKNGMNEKIEDPIPENIASMYHLPSRKTALIWIHTPKNENDKEAARKRFAFEEIFFIQLQNQLDKNALSKTKAPKIEDAEKKSVEFQKRFPFSFTEAQKESLKTIFKDFEKGSPMSRLLNGDVGSGKTAVAATSAYTVATSPPEKSFGHLQVAYMAPTEILANQHFENFITYFKGLNIPIGLITGSGCKKFPSKVNPGGSTPISRSQLLKWVENGEIAILIGTHALTFGKVKFKNLAYVIIDEQHRFGTKQRMKLARKDESVPHLLSMTATPIPRTLALSIYGNLDLSVLDQMPSGRKPVITEIVLPNKRETTYDFIKKEMDLGRQAYIICPRINEPDPDKEMALNAKSVKEEAKRLKKEIFKDKNIDILHSKMLPKDKEKVMKDFLNKKIDILVATSVVEVGVNVPNATIIVIEGAERFGLSQLHQLRGRVIRSNHQAYCFIFAETKSEKTAERLKAFKTAKDGFELGEMDLRLRGAGDLSGDSQWGITDIGMEAIKNLKLVEIAKEEAKKIIETDPELKKYPLLKFELENREKIHFE